MLTLEAPAKQNAMSCCHKTQHTAGVSTSLFIRKDTLELLEKISAIAVGVFSALVSPLLFVASFAFGAAIGLFDKENRTVGGSQPGSAVSSCSKGFMEGVTGIRLPPLLSLTANFAVMIAHVEHHATVFVPISGVILGMWAGKAVAPSIDLAFKKIESFAAA